MADLWVAAGWANQVDQKDELGHQCQPKRVGKKISAGDEMALLGGFGHVDVCGGRSTVARSQERGLPRFLPKQISK